MRNSIYPFFIAILMSGCSYVPLYSPEMINHPLISQKGDIHVSVSGFLPGVVGFMSAAGISNRFSVMANGFYSSNNPLHHQYAELALGFYGLEKEKVTELFVGAGAAKAKSIPEHCDSGEMWCYNGDIIQEKGSYRRFFLQMNRQMSHGFFQAIGSLRISAVRFSKIDKIEQVYNEQNYQVHFFSEVMPSAWQYYFEPAGTLRMSYKHLQLDWQVGFSLPFARTLKYGHTAFWMGTGINYHFNVEGE